METNKYVLTLYLRVEIEAFSEADAREAVEDAFGEGEACGFNIHDCETLDVEKLGR